MEDGLFNFKKDIKGITGWLTEREGNFLYQESKKIDSEGVIVEIGSWKGKSTSCLAFGSKDGNGAKIFAIDPHVGSREHQKKHKKINTYKDFLDNLEKNNLMKFVNPIKKTSKEAHQEFSGRVKLIFIDGAHDYKNVKLDFNLWFPKLENKGIIAFHDSWTFPGPNCFTSLLIFVSDKVRRPKLIDTITVFEKCELNNFSERMVNILFWFYRTFIGGPIGWFRIMFSSDKER